MLLQGVETRFKEKLNNDTTLFIKEVLKFDIQLLTL